MKKRNDGRKGTGLALHASTVSLTTARAVTSHLRKRYREKYLGRHPYPAFVFSIDLSILALAAFLVGLNIYLFAVLPAPIGDYRLDLSAAAIRTAEPLALEARVQVTASSTREAVRLAWLLPSGTEILQSDPPLSSNNEAFLGSIKPGESATSRIIVRLFQSPGAVTFEFRVHDARGVVSGRESRRIEGSGLRFEPIIPLTYLKTGSEIPYVLRNDTNLELHGVAVGEQSFEALAPFEERVIVLTPDASAPVRVEASVNGVSVVQRDEAFAFLNADPAEARIVMSPAGGSVAHLTVETTRPVSVAVYHPGLAEQGHVKTYDVPVGRTNLSVPVGAVPEGAGEWFALPFVRRTDGTAIGKLVRAPLTTAFDLSVAARYYAANGDQIGIGPLPPMVGESTKYWVQLKLAPTTADISNVRMAVRLGPNVAVTGRSALPDGGSFVQTGDELVWTSDYVPANSQGASASFEVELIPDANQRGTVPGLISSASASAIDQHNQVTLESSASGVDANLPDDEKGKNKGTVK